MSRTESQRQPESHSVPEGEAVRLVQALTSVVHPAILSAPRVQWHDVEPEYLRYLLNHVAETAWMNPLALALVILQTSVRLGTRSLGRVLSELHARWRVLFPAYGLVTFADWNPVEHLPRYLQDQAMSDTIATRQEFLHTYASTSSHMHAYLRSLPAHQRAVYEPWVFPPVPPDLVRRLSRMDEVRTRRMAQRKEETDAVLPAFVRMRSEAHLRWNQLHRLHTMFEQAVTRVQSGEAIIPLAFSYEEPATRERLHFLLWDRPQFVLAHASAYGTTTRQTARRQLRYAESHHPHYFLEFVGARTRENAAAGPDPEALLWFADLLRYQVLGTQPQYGSQEERERKQAYLRSWGYEAEPGGWAEPFNTGVAGLLTWLRDDGSSTFLHVAQPRTSHLLLQVEPLLAAATFGLAALDVFTTAGARMIELQQISLTPDCLYTLEVEGAQRLLLRLIPKGTDVPAEYLVSAETRRNLEKVAHLLQQHYQLREGEPIPSVSFRGKKGQGGSFQDARPYLFQFHRQHLLATSIIACMRFLLHGMVFQTAGGRAVPLTAHLLRHVFATHIHRVEHVPIDVVAMILHHKNPRVTRYYAAPPWQQVLTTATTVLDHFATHLGSHR